jgi:dTDP-4-amino-4,6-dideoxygalactose transaminase
MRIGRTLPPASSPLSLQDLINGFIGLFYPVKALSTLNKSLLEYYNCKHVFLISSGKAALTLCLNALKESNPERKYVVIPAFDCYSVPSAIAKSGLKVLPCDVDKRTLQLDKKALNQIITAHNDILAVVPTHLYGIPEDIRSVKEFVAGKGITVIEDAAQVMGSRYNGSLFGTQGDIGIFSFSRGKAISAGEGGVLITNSDSIANVISKHYSNLENYSIVERTRILIENILLSILINPWIFWLPKSMPFLKLGETIFDIHFKIKRLSGVQAGFARNWILKINKLNKSRNDRVLQYKSLLSGCNMDLLSDQFDINQLTCIRFPLLLNSPEKSAILLDLSEKFGLGIAKTYPDTINNLKSIVGENIACPNAPTLVKQLVTLPCHSLVTQKDIRNIVQLVKHIMAN